MAQGRILSIESMGLVDGPGVRTVVFFQGCSLRCLFCHNPDSWAKEGGELIASDVLLKKLLRFKPYYKRSGGGVTFSGGEPLLQKDFLLDMLSLCKKNNIHTCLDTAGAGVGGYDEILSLCDLVLYDVKAIDSAGYEKMCRAKMEETQRFLEALKRIRPETVVRQVVVPGINDSDEYMKNLKIYIDKNIPFASSVELLAYHRMGEYKYHKLGIRPALGDTEEMDKAKAEKLWQKYFGDYKNPAVQANDDLGKLREGTDV